MSFKEEYNEYKREQVDSGYEVLSFEDWVKTKKRKKEERSMKSILDKVKEILDGKDVKFVVLEQPYYDPKSDEDFPQAPQEDDFVMSPSGHLGSKTSVSLYGNKFLGEFDSEDEAEKFIRDYKEKNKWFADVWSMSDHGDFYRVSLESKERKNRCVESYPYTDIGNTDEREYKIPFFAKNINDLVNIEDEEFQKFLRNELSSGDMIITDDGNKFIGIDVMDFIPRTEAADYDKYNNPECDANGDYKCTQGETKRVEFGGGAGGNFCKYHFEKEMEFRKERNKNLPKENQYDVIKWDDVNRTRTKEAGEHGSPVFINGYRIDEVPQAGIWRVRMPNNRIAIINKKRARTAGDVYNILKNDPSFKVESLSIKEEVKWAVPAPGMKWVVPDKSTIQRVKDLDWTVGYKIIKVLQNEETGAEAVVINTDGGNWYILWSSGDISEFEKDKDQAIDYLNQMAQTPGELL